MPPIEYRKFNLLEGFIGTVGCGKTEAAVFRLLELQKIPVYVIAFDPDGNIPEELHDGTETGVSRHETIEECKIGVRDEPACIHSIEGESFEDVLAYAEALALASLARYGTRENSGDPIKGIPVVLYIDEGVLVDDADSHRIGDELKKFIARRRHKHVGLIYTIQDPTWIHKSILTLATRNHFFLIEGDDQLNFLRRRVGIKPDAIERIRNLKRYQSETIFTNPFENDRD